MAAEFLQDFKKRFDAAFQRLENLNKSVSKDQLEKELDEVAGQLKQLKVFLSENAQLLTKYDLKRRQGDVKMLEDSIAAKSTELISSQSSFSFDISAPSFSFAKPKESKPAPSEADSAVKIDESEKLTPIVQDADTFVISNCRDMTIVYEGEEARAKLSGKELELANVIGCRIKILTHVPAVRVNKATDCEIICGPVSTSVFIEEATNCSFVMAAQQFRIHAAKDCRFYIHVTSKAIIESCRQLSFAPYNLNYKNMLEDFWAANLKLYDVPNNWDKVDDFDWPSASAKRPSPNWSILPEEKRVTSWISSEK